MEDKPKIMPLVWLLIALLLLTAMHFWLPLGRWIERPWNWGGAVPALLGLWMMAVSARRFQKVETGLIPFDEATVLVTGGFFRYTRNPMYLGMVLLLLGIACMLGTAGSFVAAPLFAWVIRRNFILPEELFMERPFGEEYLAYKRSVRRWL